MAWPGVVGVLALVLSLLAAPLAAEALQAKVYRVGGFIKGVPKTGARLVRHVRYYRLQLVESHLTQRLFGQFLGRIERLAWHPT